MNGPHWIKQWISDLAFLNEQFRNDDGSVDFEALGKEEYRFRTALITQKFAKSERAKETFAKAKAAYDASSENGKKGGRPRKNQDTTADGVIREDSQDRKSGTSANHYGDAPHREAGDESATVSRNMRRVPQNEAPAHVFSGGRTAQGTMSPSPSGAAQDGKFGSRHACSDKDRREQWESNTGSTVPAVRPESGNIYDQEACQVSTDEARKSKVRSSSMSAPSGRTGDGNIEPEVLNFAYSGEFGNVSLTQDQYNELLQQVGNIKTCNGLIDDFSASLADGSTKSGNHFATLKKWAKARKRFNEEKAEQTHYETVSEHNMRVLANGKKWVAEHFGKEATNG